jgi:hypothetical protein
MFHVKQDVATTFQPTNVSRETREQANTPAIRGLWHRLATPRAGAKEAAMIEFIFVRAFGAGY